MKSRNHNQSFHKYSIIHSIQAEIQWNKIKIRTTYKKLTEIVGRGLHLSQIVVVIEATILSFSVDHRFPLVHIEEGKEEIVMGINAFWDKRLIVGGKLKD